MFKTVDRIRVTECEVKFEDVLKVKTQMKNNETMVESRRKSFKKDKKGTNLTTSTVVKNDSHELAAGDNKGLPRDFGLFYGPDGTAVWREKPIKLHCAKMLHMVDESLDEESFTVLDYPIEYPEAVDVTNFIDQQGFVKSLDSEEVYQEFKAVYNEHVLEKFRAVKQNKSRINSHAEIFDDSCVVPLSLILPEYVIDLGEIPLNSQVEKVERIFFHGSQIKAALRTEAFISSFTLKFLQSSETKHHTKIIDYDVESLNQEKNYQNRYQRESHEATEAQHIVKRCHSFDFTSARVHSRRIPLTARERQENNRVYNQAMSTKKKIQKNPFLQSELFEESNSIDGPKIVDFKITLSPDDFYEPGMVFDEIVFLDVSYVVRKFKTLTKY